jgi:hypothetical protein
MNTKMTLKTLVIALGLGATAISGNVLAASGTSTATPAVVANQVNFSIVIPAFLTFRVGTVGATINTMLFTVPVANVGNATAVAATGGDAPAGGTGVNVSVIGNRGQVTITTAVAGAGAGLGTGTAADGFINYNQISTVSTNVGGLNAPVLANAAVPAVLPTLGVGPAGRVTNQTAIWNYSYLNTTVPSSGTYTGSATYTATMP